MADEVPAGEQTTVTVHIDVPADEWALADSRDEQEQLMARSIDLGTYGVDEVQNEY